MLSIDALKEYGADTADGLERCFNNEEFYLGLVKTVPGDANFDKLPGLIEAGDLNAAFESAHALKGVLANLSLTSFYEPVNELTEHLRAKESMDYKPLLSKVEERRAALLKICEE